MALLDHGLTDLDLLREGVFGGPLPPPARLQAIVGDAERLVAVQAEHFPPAPPGARWLHIHPGIGYLLWRGSSPLARLRLARRTLVGESQPLSLGLVHAVQQALVSLRRRELAPLARRHPGILAFAAESAVFSDLVASLRSGGDWDAAWERWSALVVLRHQYQINSVRRKLVELLALATRDIDIDRGLSWPFRAFIETVYSTYALLPLIAAARSRLADIAPHLARPRPGALPPPLAAALGWAEARLTEPVSLRHAARAAGVAPEHLARLARAHLGRSFLDHLTGLRLDEAQRLLAAGPEPVRAVAMRCGFASPEHFQRTFRRRIGISPGRWRRERAAVG